MGWSAWSVRGRSIETCRVAGVRVTHPEIRFEEGSLTALPFPDGFLGGVVSWYSIIHTPPEHLDEVFAELKRVLNSDGSALLAFQSGDGARVHRADAYGTGMPLDSYWHSPDVVTRSLTAAGLHVHARALREPEFDHESTPQAFILARPSRPAGASPPLTPKP